MNPSTRSPQRRWRANRRLESGRSLGIRSSRRSLHPIAFGLFENWVACFPRSYRASHFVPIRSLLFGCVHAPLLVVMRIINVGIIGQKKLGNLYGCDNVAVTAIAYIPFVPRTVCYGNDGLKGSRHVERDRHLTRDSRVRTLAVEAPGRVEASRSGRTVNERHLVVEHDQECDLMEAELERKQTAAAAPTNASVDPLDDPTNDEWTDRRASKQALRAATARQASGRRRFVDPTTCERDYSNAEMEFMRAMQEYKQRSGRMFPTWSEVLEVLRGLGYEKLDSDSPAPPEAAPTKAKHSKKRNPPGDEATTRSSMNPMFAFSADFDPKVLVDNRRDDAKSKLDSASPKPRKRDSVIELDPQNADILTTIAAKPRKKRRLPAKVEC